MKNNVNNDQPSNFVKLDTKELMTKFFGVRAMDHILISIAGCTSATIEY